MNLKSFLKANLSGAEMVLRSSVGVPKVSEIHFSIVQNSGRL